MRVALAGAGRPNRAAADCHDDSGAARSTADFASEGGRGSPPCHVVDRSWRVHATTNADSALISRTTHESLERYVRSTEMRMGRHRSALPAESGSAAYEELRWRSARGVYDLAADVSARRTIAGRDRTTLLAGTVSATDVSLAWSCSCRAVPPARRSKRDQDGDRLVFIWEIPGLSALLRGARLPGGPGSRPWHVGPIWPILRQSADAGRRCSRIG